MSEGSDFPLGGPGRALPPGSPWGFPLLFPCPCPPSPIPPPLSRLCCRPFLGWVSSTAYLPPLLPTLCSPLEAWLGHRSFLSLQHLLASLGLLRSGLVGVFPGGGGWLQSHPGALPGHACSVPTLGRTSLLAGTQGALCPAGGWRSSSMRRTAAWMCSSSTWPLPSAPSRKPLCSSLHSAPLSPDPCFSAPHPLLGPCPSCAARACPGLTQTTPCTVGNAPS